MTPPALYIFWLLVLCEDLSMCCVRFAACVMCSFSLCYVLFLRSDTSLRARCGRSAPAAGAPCPLRALRAHAYDTGVARPRGSLREPRLASLASFLLSRLAGFYGLPDWQRQSVLPIANARLLTDYYLLATSYFNFSYPAWTRFPIFPA